MTDTISPAVPQSMFDTPTDVRTMVRKSDPETSRNAATAVDKESDCDLVRRILRGKPAGLTDFEIAEIASELTGKERLQTSLGKRRHDLGEEVVWTGERRPTKSGASARVWRLVMSPAMGTEHCGG